MFLALTTVTGAGSGSEMVIDDDLNGGHPQSDPVQAIGMDLEVEPDEIMEEVNSNAADQLNYSFLDDSDVERILNSPPAYEEYSEDNALGLCTKTHFHET